jgi:nucleotide-binding universal stress UspA family protein
MREFKTILCPTDFSEASYRALEYAVRFARVADGTLLLAHIVHVPTEDLMHPGVLVPSFDDVKARAQKLLEEVRAQRLGGYGKCELLLDVGDPYEQLMEMANQRHADLIVVCTHGRTGLQHLVIGSVAEKIIRHAPCPVFVVRRGAA